MTSYAIDTTLKITATHLTPFKECIDRRSKGFKAIAYLVA